MYVETENVDFMYTIVHGSHKYFVNINIVMAGIFSDVKVWLSLLVYTTVSRDKVLL